MADYFPCKIEIGGKLNPSQVEKIVEICRNSGGRLGWGESAPTVEEIIQAIEVDEELIISDDQARYGQMEDLESYLTEEKIPFIEQSDGRYEFDAMKTWFDGKETFSFPSNQSEDQLVESDVVKKAIDSIENGKMDEALNILRRAVVEPKLEKVSINTSEKLNETAEAENRLALWKRDLDEIVDYAKVGDYFGCIRNTDLWNEVLNDHTDIYPFERSFDEYDTEWFGIETNQQSFISFVEKVIEREQTASIQQVAMAVGENVSLKDAVDSLKKTDNSPKMQ